MQAAHRLATAHSIDLAVARSHTGAVALGDVSVSDADRMISSTSGSSAPAGYRFPGEVIAVAVRWYSR